MDHGLRVRDDLRKALGSQGGSSAPHRYRFTGIDPAPPALHGVGPKTSSIATSFTLPRFSARIPGSIFSRIAGVRAPINMQGAMELLGSLRRSLTRYALRPKYPSLTRGGRHER